MNTASTTVIKQRILEKLSNALSPSATASRSMSILQANRANNHFLAVMLNGFARQAEGHTLTKLEQKFVDSFRAMGLTDEDVSTLGRAFADAPEAVRAQLFPERFANLRTSTAYGEEELSADRPAICKAAMESKNVMVVNAAKHTYPAVKTSQNVARNEAGELTVDGQPARAEDIVFEVDENAPSPTPDKSYLDACREMGGGVVCYGLPVTDPPRALPKAGSLGRYRFWAHKLLCLKDTGENWSDEPYYLFATTDGITGSDYQSEVFHDVDPIETHYFQWNVLWDKNVDGGGIYMSIAGWERDSGNEYSAGQRIMDEIIKYLIDELFIDGWDEIAVAIIGEITGVGVPLGSSPSPWASPLLSEYSSAIRTTMPATGVS